MGWQVNIITCYVIFELNKEDTQHKAHEVRSTSEPWFIIHITKNIHTWCLTESRKIEFMFNIEY